MKQSLAMKTKNFLINSLEDLEHFAKKLANHLKPGDIITFIGNLGAGKTTLIKSIVQALNIVDVEVTSPTFNLVHIYDSLKCKIWHFDLYRLKDKEEIFELGIEDAYGVAICLIEWPQIINDILPKNKLDITIDFISKDNSRNIKLEGHYEWVERL